MKVKSESEVAQSCPTLSDPTDCSPPGSSIHGIFQARVLEWGAIAFSVSLSTTTYVFDSWPALKPDCEILEEKRDRLSTPGVYLNLFSSQICLLLFTLKSPQVSVSFILSWFYYCAQW